MLRMIVLRLRSLFRRNAAEQDLDDELKFHIEQQTKVYIKAGLTPEEARRLVRLEFGGVEQIKEECRDVRIFAFIESLLRDLRYGIRLLAKSPGFTAVAVLTLALGIGMNTAIFTLIDAVILRPLPYKDPERLVMIWTTDAESHRSMFSSYPDFQDWEKRNHVFQRIAAFHVSEFNLSGGDRPDRVVGLCVSPGLFKVLGVQPVVGRTLLPEEQDRVALLSHGLWTRRFGADPKLVGATISLDSQTYTVIGILPAGFHFPPVRYGYGHEPEVFVPVSPKPNRGSFFLQSIARLKPEISISQAQAEMDTIAKALERAYPETNRDRGVNVGAIHQHAVGDSRRTLLIFLGAAGFVLLIACANVANMLLARAMARQREIAIRAALGAGRWRLIRQLLTESVLLGMVGGLLGLLLAAWIVPLLVAALPVRSMYAVRIHDAGIELNSSVLAFTFAVSLVTGLIFGIAPARQSPQAATSSLRSGRGSRLRGVLVAAEVALSLVLLAGAGLLMKSFIRLIEVDPGFQVENLLTMGIDLPKPKYLDAERQASFFQEVLERVQNLPGVRSAAVVNTLPLTMSHLRNSFRIEGARGQTATAGFRAVSSGYFHTMGIPLLRGRLFTDRDSNHEVGVAVINNAMARRYWPGQDPVGRRIESAKPYFEQTSEGLRRRLRKQRTEIVGVVADVRHDGLDAEPDPEMYMPYFQVPTTDMTLVLRSAVDPATLATAARKEVEAVDPDQPVTGIKTMEQLVSEDVAGRRFVLLLIGTFASLALLLAAAGIYGVISYSVSQRTQEIGIRMALGAQRADVIRLVLRQNVAWILPGLGTGLAGAFALTRLLSAYLYEVKPVDPATFAAAVFALASIALVAGYIPARRATKIDPMEALRHE